MGVWRKALACLCVCGAFFALSVPVHVPPVTVSSGVPAGEMWKSEVLLTDTLTFCNL